MTTKLMIVDDNKEILSSYQYFLAKDKNIEVVAEALDGETALKLYKEKKPDLLFLDLQIPKLNGLEVINELCKDKTEERKCNIVICSGDTTLRSNIYKTQKVYRVLSKPFTPNEILTTVYDYKNFIDEYNNDFDAEKLRGILFKLEIDIYSTSCKYLTDVIQFTYDNPTMLENNLKKVYSLIAKRYNCSDESIRSSIRHSIRIVERYNDEDVIYSIFHVTLKNRSRILTPRYFIECFIEYLKK